MGGYREPSLSELIADGQDPADASNHVAAEAVMEHAAQIAALAAKCDANLGTYLEPDGDRWGWGDDSLTDMVAAFVALRDASAELALVVKYAEQLACDALGRDTVVYADRSFKVRRSPRRTFPPEKRQELRDEMRRSVSRQVALDPITGDLDSDRARVAVQTIDLVDRWQTIDGSKFKLGQLKAEGLDVDEFAETEWSARIEEIRE